MEMSGQQRIAAARETVWAALNDPEVLKQCIPGCQELTKEGDNAFAAKVRAKVGPVSANFTGQVTLSDIVPPESYTISGEGKGGAAGFAKGGAKVSLAEDGDGTLLSYDVDAKVGGKMAQLGGRLIDGTARKMADDFFSRFSELVAPAPPEEPGEAPEAAPEEAPAEAPKAVEPTAATPPAAAATAGEATPSEPERRSVLLPILVVAGIVAFALIVYQLMQG